MMIGVVVLEEVDQEVLDEDQEVQKDDTGIPSSIFMIAVKCTPI